jgi:hypothetical protein
LIREHCHKIEYLNNNFAEARAFTSELKEGCIEAAVALLSSLTFTINFLRNHIIYSTQGKPVDIEWKLLDEQFSASSRKFDDVLSRAEKLSKFSGRFSQPRLISASTAASESDSLSASLKRVSLPDEQARQQCVILPSIRTSRFFDRIDVVQNIDDYFNQVDPEQSFRSLALHGLAGVGKSTVALRFAENKFRRGELDALFWVHSEKLVSIRQSFTDIAIRLKLTDAHQGDHDENRFLVLNWLQHTCKLVLNGWVA